MKSLAVSRLRNLFGDRAKRCVPEYTLKAPVTDDVDYRQADALVEFEHRDSQLGEGLIVEVQYRNKSKDIGVTTDDFLAQDYSVIWAEGQHFTSDLFEIRPMLDALETS